MNAKLMIAAAAMLMAAGSVLADDTYPYVDHSKFVSTKTRAAVLAELNRASADSRIARNTEFVEHNNVASTRTRDEVRNEAIQSASGKQAKGANFGG